MKVATTVLKNQNKILLIKKPTNRYSMPGGKTEHLEIPIQTANREFYEETGLILESLSLNVISKVDASDKTYELYTFFSDSFSGELLSHSEEGILVWVEISELSKINMYPSDYDIIMHCLEDDEVVNMNFVY